jgi:hypothetical protein
MPLAKRKQVRVSTAKIRRKSAVEALTDEFNALMEEQEAKMTDEEYI